MKIHSAKVIVTCLSCRNLVTLKILTDDVLRGIGDAHARSTR